MKGDFSYLAPAALGNDTAVLHQQGRVLLDRDWNEAAAIDARWRDAIGRDAFGPGVLAVASSAVDSFRVLSAITNGQTIDVTLHAGSAWADGLSVSLSADTTREATYLTPPLRQRQESARDIVAGTRDLVVLDVWEDGVNGFQDPSNLVEPALGGPDTTERVRAFMSAKLMRLGPNDDCSTVRAVADDFEAKGKLTVTPAPVLTITGDCPIDAGGGYTGLEHYLYRIEIAEPTGGSPRFKWSQFNGGLVGRGLYAALTATTGTLNITANEQMITRCGLPSFYLEALQYDNLAGQWIVTFTADASLQNGALSLTNASGVWPANYPETGFFRLWNGIARVSAFGPGVPDPKLNDGIQLAFTSPFTTTRYIPGDYWTFPVRAVGSTFETAQWPTDSPPHGVRHRRVALGILTWGADLQALYERADVEDCRRIFRPLTNQKVCCTFNVGDGVTSRGDFDSIEDALRHLPRSGGEICLLPGTHQTNAVIRGREDVTIKGCGARTKVIPRQRTPDLPIFRVVDSRVVCLDHMELTTLGGSAILVEASRPGGTENVEIARNNIIACQNAIRVTNSTGVKIQHNQIRMLDKRAAGVAIFLAADDSLVERNDIRLLHRRVTPPFRVPDAPNPIDVSDPCAKPDVAYVNRRLFSGYIASLWAFPLPIRAIFVEPYLALGGIQIGGGSERVRVIENVVVGGAGNGITLGTAMSPSPPQPAFSPDLRITVTVPRSAIAGIVQGPSGPLDGVQVSLTKATGSATPETKVTADGGRFAFDGVGLGTYQVTVAATGFELDSFDALTITDNGGVRTHRTMLRMRKAATAAQDDESGYLYDIAIERNEVSSMGLSGIGIASVLTMPAPAVNAGRLAMVAIERPVVSARRLLGTPIVRLAIRENRIHDCLRNPFDRDLQSEAATRGLGGISLAMCEDLVIDANRIEQNGVSGIDPVCGIFVSWGDRVAITHNHVLDNGLLSGNLDAKLNPGVRGGIVLNMVTSFSVLDVLSGETAGEIDPLPAARVHANVIDQPVGQALHIDAVGPVMCSDNAFASERSSATSDFEVIAGTVWIHNIGGIQNTDATKQIKPTTLTTGAAAAAVVGTPIARVDAGFTRTEVAERVLPGGATQFHDNQSRTGASNTSFTCHLIAAAEDLGYQGNQSTSLGRGNLLANGVLHAGTLRACLNRMIERSPSALASLWTVAVRMNDTSLNQGDHCIIATDMNPTMTEIKTGNQVLNATPWCPTINLINIKSFKTIRVNP